MSTPAPTEPTPGAADTTIVVVPREQFGVAIRSLDSILEHTDGPYELVYVDGRSPAPIRAELEERAQRYGFKLLRSDRYLSPNRARNLAMRHVEKRYVVFVDNDLIVTPGWLSRLRECAEATGAWVVGPLYLEGEPEERIIHMAGGTYRLSGEAPHRSFETTHILQKTRLADLDEPLQRGRCDFVEFHCLLARTEALGELGEFDEDLLNTREHLDLCMAVQAAGGEVWFEPASIVTYKTPPPLDRADVPYFLLRWSESWTRRSLRHFVAKHGIDASYVERARIARSRRSIVFTPLVERAKRIVGQRIAGALARGLGGCERMFNAAFVRGSRRPEVRTVP